MPGNHFVALCTAMPPRAIASLRQRTSSNIMRRRGSKSGYPFMFKRRRHEISTTSPCYATPISHSLLQISYQQQAHELRPYALFNILVKSPASNCSIASCSSFNVRGFFPSSSAASLALIFAIPAWTSSIGSTGSLTASGFSRS